MLSTLGLSDSLVTFFPNLTTFIFWPVLFVRWIDLLVTLWSSLRLQASPSVCLIREVALTTIHCFLLVSSYFQKDNFHARRCKVNRYRQGKIQTRITSFLTIWMLPWAAGCTNGLRPAVQPLENLFCESLPQQGLAWLLGSDIPSTLPPCSHEPESPSEDHKLSA